MTDEPSFKWNEDKNPEEISDAETMKVDRTHIVRT